MAARAESDSLFDDLEDDLLGELTAPTRSGASIEPADFDESLTRLGRLLPRSVHLGTSSWYFPGWRDLVWRGDTDYTESRLARHGLSCVRATPAVSLRRHRSHVLPAPDGGRIRKLRRSGTERLSLRRESASDG